MSELSAIQSKPVTVHNVKVTASTDLSSKTGGVKFPCQLTLDMEEVKDFRLVLSNTAGEELIIGYDKKQNQYFIDRTKSGKTDFQKDFANRHVAPRLSDNGKMDISLIIDVSSVELFADEGLSAMTEIFFPNKPYTQIRLESGSNIVIKKMEYIALSAYNK